MQDSSEPASVWRRLWEGWKRFAHAVGVFNTRVIMTLLYFVVVLPFGIVVRVVSDPLRLKPPPGSNWSAVLPRSRDLDSVREQY
ncbi:MAG: hypothetical protein KatS3mg076_0549 [Candidatus Binatia bacterium]|nr:MAG: hypothetical protein KatS3mg076_0549 [Candidatus Binatia bacterium]